MTLKIYHKKRDFKQTPEPYGKQKIKSQGIYIIQKHAASHLHYDFRLQLDGVLKSWAVPKGPSLDPSVKRLAVHVEDHPIEYASFQGTIPKGQYGGGTVMLWDKGNWECMDESPRKAYRAGNLTFVIKGNKLHGAWKLIRLQRSPKNWLLMKLNDDHALPEKKYDITAKEPLSVTTGQTMDEIAQKKKPKKTSVKKRTSLKGSSTFVKTNFALSNPDRVLYPEQGITKLQLAEYYNEIKEWILPYIKNRPLTLVRCPQGRQKHCFYQKHLTDIPAGIETIPIKEKLKTGQYPYLKKIDGLISLVQLGVLEIHPWGSRIDHIEKPDMIIFDLDPAPNIEWKKIVAAAFHVREQLEDFGLKSFLKTTGGKGLHVVVPIKRRYSWDDVKGFSHAIVDFIVAQNPKDYLSNMSKAKRSGKIFLDYLRNGRGATAIAPYSTRAREFAPVATPLAWEELNAKLKPTSLNIKSIPERLRKLKHDPWEDFFDSAQNLIGLDKIKK